MQSVKRIREAVSQLAQSVDMHPVRKSKKLLAIAQKAKGLGIHLMELAFTSKGEGEWPRKRRLWNGATSLFEVAAEARDLARNALAEGKAKLGFGYGPTGNAVPRWSVGGSNPGDLGVAR